MLCDRREIKMNESDKCSEKSEIKQENFIDNSVRTASRFGIDDIVSEKIEKSGYKISEKYSRKKYVNQSEMARYKKNYFNDRKTASDEYTGQILHSDKTASINKYGKNKYTNHTPDTDHIVPLKELHKNAKHKTISDDQLKEIANSSDNFAVTSEHNNRSKGAKTNKGFAEGNNDLLVRENKDAIVNKANAAESKLMRKVNGQAVKNVAKVSNQAGLEASGYSAVIGGSISTVQNIVALIKNEKSVEDALFDIAKDTTVAAAAGYGTGFADSAIKGFMQNTQSKTLQAISKTNLPMAAIAVAINATKTFGSYLNGDISGLECFEQLGEQGVGALSSALGATIGQIAIPIPVVGSVIGGMIGYALSSASYEVLLSSLKEAKMAKECREATERACAEHIKMIRAYRLEVEQTISKYFDEYMTLFNNSFDGIKQSLQIGDVDGFISSTNEITIGLGKNPVFNNRKEFDDLMQSETIIKI